MLKLTCPSCAMIIRTTAKWIDESGPPICNGAACDHVPFELA